MTVENSTGQNVNRTEETFGIHLLKVGAILPQIAAHSYLWSVQQQLVKLGHTGSTFWNLSTYTILSLALLLPMTAGAVLRMVSQVQGDKVVNINWQVIGWSSFALMLIESFKQAAMYGSGAFFSWNVLHLIAVTFPLLLLLGRVSIKLVWSVGLSILLVTPAVIRPLTHYDITLPLGWWPAGLSITGVILAALLFILMVIAVRRALKSQSIAPTHRKRFALFLFAAAAVAIALLLQLPPHGLERLEIATLPLGALVGTENGLHIWAFFPWAGSILLGFAIYDLLIRTRASVITMLCMIAMGIILLVIFYDRYAYEVTSSMSASSFFSGYHFNRTPEKMVMVIGLFLLAVPLVTVLARWGAERPYVILLSRYVLWLYVYQTTLLMLLPAWVHELTASWLTARQGVFLSGALALGSAIALPAVIRRIPLNLRLQLSRK